ncbi:P-type conjugative transfer protein VirB9 [Arhodomonas sp. AD133]|uniref:P-type conjugative transfer protein VirB9 n=1 Tax=Arhodomonas sp. AD133 TaxID=3415009 RepID=UPI003EB6E3CF
MIAAAALAIVATQSQAVETARPGRSDPRVKTVTYKPTDVVRVNAHYRTSSHIVFGDNETIQHISIGDSLAWMVVNKQNHLFLKPIEGDPDTNMTVLTNKRTYNFELRGAKANNVSDEDLTFEMRFYYPQEALKRQLAKEIAEREKDEQVVVPDRRVDPTALNWDYSMKGSDTHAPVRVFDDGEFTYFRFPDEADVPAIFQVAEDGSEALVNHHVRGQYIVVQRTAAQFTLRQGNSVTCIFNNSYAARKTPSDAVPVAATTKE